MNALALAAGLSVARLVPVRFNGGIPANDERDACTGTCGRCGASAWHPEIRTCTATDCDLRYAREEPRGGDG